MLAAVQIKVLHAQTMSPRARSLARFKSQCDNDGSGKACYNYGRALWSTPGMMDRKLARKYLARGCELKYELACKAYHDHLTTTRYSHPSYENRDICYSSKELTTARLITTTFADAKVTGQKIDQIKNNSFWQKAGLQENDTLVKMNNMPLRTTAEAQKAFGAAGKKFGFEVRRGEDTLTLWYTCE